MVGLSPPEWCALIVQNYAFDAVPYQDVFEHELSHQFFCPHCDNHFCVMYPSLECFGRDWCDNCKGIINAHATRYWRWIPTQGGGGGGCPTLFVGDGADYAEEGILNIHAESDITVQHRIQNTLALENGVYKLQLRELDNYTSHIDQVKLYAVDYQGKWRLCPLTYAYHNELGKVTSKLFFDDSKRVDLEPTEVIDLKFTPSIPPSQTAYFTFEINGYNMKTPGE